MSLLLGTQQNTIDFLTFNALFPRFIRRDRECYNSYDKFVNSEKDYQKLLNNAFLLGLDIDLIINKLELRNEQVQIDDARKKLRKDKVLK